jgi:hypothetical protein
MKTNNYRQCESKYGQKGGEAYAGVKIGTNVNYYERINS